MKLETILISNSNNKQKVLAVAIALTLLAVLTILFLRATPTIADVQNRLKTSLGGNDHNVEVTQLHREGVAVSDWYRIIAEERVYFYNYTADFLVSGNIFHLPSEVNLIKLEQSKFTDGFVRSNTKQSQKIRTLTGIDKNAGSTNVSFEQNFNFEDAKRKAKDLGYPIDVIDKVTKKMIDNGYDISESDVSKAIEQRAEIATSFQTRQKNKTISSEKTKSLVNEDFNEINELKKLNPNSEEFRNRFMTFNASKIVNNLPDSKTIFYKAEGVEKDVLTIITDPSCPHCQSLHNAVPGLVKNGYSVRYLITPRSVRLNDKIQMPPNQALSIQHAFCADNPKIAIDSLYKMKGRYIKRHDLESCDIENKNVFNNYTVSKFIINTQGGTPVILSDNGMVSGIDGVEVGYPGYTKLLKNLKRFEGATSPLKVALNDSEDGW